MQASNFSQISQKSSQLNTQSNKRLIKKQANVLFHFEDDDSDQNENQDQIQIQDLSINEKQNTQTNKQNIKGKFQQALQKPTNKNSNHFFKQQTFQVRNQSPSKIIQIKSNVIQVSPTRFRKKRALQQQEISSLQNEEKSDYIIVQKQNSENRQNQVIMDQSSYNLYPKNNQTLFTKNQLSEARLYDQLKESDTMSPQKQSSPEKLFARFHSKNMNQDILQPNQKELQASQIYAKMIFQKLKEQSSKQKIMGIHKFTSQPLEGTYPTDYVRFLFQIHIYKYYFSTDYQLWLRNSQGQLIKLLKAEKDPLGYRSSCLMLYQVSESQKHQKVFTGKLNYNITKNQYHLYDIDEITYPDKPRQMLATIFYTSPYTNVQRKVQIIIPKREFYDHDFIRSQSKKNLLAFKETQKVQQLKTHKMVPQQLNLLKEQFQLKKSQRVLCLQDEKKSKKLFIGKIQTNRYIMIVGKGITPLQAFATAIVNFQH